MTGADLLDLSPHKAGEVAADLADDADRDREPDPVDPVAADDERHYHLGREFGRTRTPGAYLAAWGTEPVNRKES